MSADGGLPWKGSPEPFFNENGEDGWHEKEQGMDYWDYVKNNGPSQYEGTRVADFDNSVSKVRIRDNVKGIGRKAFMEVTGWKKYVWEKKITSLSQKLLHHA